MRQEAIYARQSVDKKDSVSIEAQIEQCRALAKTQEPLVFQDKGFSGKNTERPDLKRLFEAIRAGRISTVYVYKLDRISRNIVDFNQLYQTMEAYGTEFVSVNEKFDTSSVMGRAMMQIIAVFAQMERETIQQRVKDNYYYRITDGRWAGGPAPYGYKNARTENNVPTLKPVPEELNLVRAAFSLYDGTATSPLPPSVPGCITRATGHAREESLYPAPSPGSCRTRSMSRLTRNYINISRQKRLSSLMSRRNGMVPLPAVSWQRRKEIPH